MEILYNIMLGIVQGLTEFLPISSSGHLSIFQNIFSMENIESNIALDIMLHVGTLVSVFIVFWQDIKELFVELGSLIADLFKGKPNINKNGYRRMIIMLIIATSPLIIAAIFNDKIEEVFFNNLYIVGGMLLITGILLYICDKLPVGKKTEEDASFPSALGVGLMQMIAVMPGLSRSGSTITAAQALGYTRKFAVKMSFLMSIFAILGASVVKAPDAVVMITQAQPNMVLGYILGMIASAVSGLFAIKFLVKIINNGKFHYFSYYCWIVGLAVIAYQFFMV